MRKNISQISFVEIEEIKDTTFEENYVIIKNNQMVNTTVISNFLTFELEFIWNSDFHCYYPEYYNLFQHVINKIPKTILKVVDLYLKSENSNHSDNAWIWIKILRNDYNQQISDDKNKNKGLFFNIGEYKKYKESLNNKFLGREGLFDDTKPVLKEEEFLALKSNGNQME